MKSMLILFWFLFSTYIGECQLKPIVVSKVFNSEVKGLHCIDTMGRISSQCPMDLDGFSIKFYYAGFDKTKKMIRLIGRVCIGDGDTCLGVSNISIFKGIKKMNMVTNKEVIGGSTYDKEYMGNDGFFDIYYTTEPSESLYFQGAGYFVKEFAIFRIIK